MGIKAFSDDFLWGTATASYQIEGSPLADGASPSIWHKFSHIPGKTKNNENGDTACDHYHRYEEDIDNLVKLGVKAYRFSIAWPRIIPEPGTINRKGIDFYKRIIDRLLKHNIEPFITLFHWDTPLWLEKLGGFRKRESVDHFLFYGETLFKEFGDRVKHWISVNEPMVYTISGYVIGDMAPGYKRDLRGLFHAAHHLLLSHSRLADALHGFSKGAVIGIAEAQVWVRPFKSGSERDKRAADLMDKLINRLYMDPVTTGGYPEKLLAKAGRYMPAGFEKDLEGMKNTCDFIGINYYTSQSYRYSLFTPMIHAKEMQTPGCKRSAMWEIYPDGIYNLLKRVKDEYNNIPCYITENGFPLNDKGRSDLLDDAERIEYLKDHIRKVMQAHKEGVNVKGYFLWSLMDNFEWNHGYDMRFGIIRVDFKTLKRSWKKSAYWYQNIIKTGLSG
ncbi:MAG: beta-glucosidase [Spirochaetes bacterium]|nr:beta-glucosidase [Spirochaetota bacterium]